MQKAVYMQSRVCFAKSFGISDRLWDICLESL